MMTNMINSVSSFLPLPVETVEWNDPNLILAGMTWSFSSVSSWRIIKDNKLVSGCYDKDSASISSILKNSEIILVEIQSSQLYIDPVFTFSNGYKLEIFSTTFLEPWIFDFSSGIVYVASPSTANTLGPGL